MTTAEQLGYYIDPMIVKQLDLIRNRVLNRDLDYVMLFDGEVGVGKSVLAMQCARYLDPSFNLSKVVFTADDFISLIKSDFTKKGDVILLDEATNAASSRASLTEVNRSMIALANEMRQKNLIVIMIIPTFFDLDRYFAIWRSRALFHLYFTNDGDRRYVVFASNAKKELYLLGKKRYTYGKPKATLPPCKFTNYYVINEQDYRQKKSDAFKDRKISNRANNWYLQRNFLLKVLIKETKFKQSDIEDLFNSCHIPPLEQQTISSLVQNRPDDSQELDELLSIKREKRGIIRNLLGKQGNNTQKPVII